MALRFGTDGVRGVANAELTPELALALGRAAARVLDGDHVVIGRDTRISGPLLEAALAAGFAAEGVNVDRLGVLPTPGVAYLSQVQYVDAGHVALSFQFFNKTRENVLANPVGTLLLIHPDTGAQFRMTVHYERTEISGPLFENMKARLAGIASHSGMAGVFRLIAADVFEVLSAEMVQGFLTEPPSDIANTGASLEGFRTEIRGLQWVS